MGKKYGYYTEDVKKMIKNMVFDETVKALSEYDSETDCAEAFIAALGAMYMITKKISTELDAEEEEKEEKKA